MPVNFLDFRYIALFRNAPLSHPCLKTAEIFSGLQTDGKGERDEIYGLGAGRGEAPNKICFKGPKYRVMRYTDIDTLLKGHQSAAWESRIWMAKMFGGKH